MTDNNGTTWTPVFDNYGSYSIGWITIDPKNPSIVWVGTGENNSQRSVSYGDGVYKSEDGGRTFRNVGLASSPSTSPASWSTRAIPTWSTLPRPARSGRAAASAASTRPPTAARPGRKASSRSDEYTGCSDVVMDPQESRRAAGRHAPAPAPLLRHDSRRTRQRPLAHASTPARPGPRCAADFPARRPGPHRPELRALQSQHHLRPGGSARRPRRPLPLHRQRRHLGAPQLLRLAGPVLRQGGGRSGQPRPRLHHERQHRGFRRWRPHPDHPRPRATSTWTITISGSTRRTTITTWWVATAASTRASTAPLPGSSKPTCPPAQFYDVAVDEDAPFYHVYGGTQDNNSVGCAVAHEEHRR